MKVKEVIGIVNSNKEVFVDLWNLTDKDVLEDNNIELELSDCVMKLPGKVHRWHTEATNIYKCDDGYVGITGFDYGHVDSVDPRDCFCYCHAEEFESKQITTYVPVRK